jgi:hypothetical protein
MSMMFFYFLKIIFDISTSKRSKKYKPYSILAKKKIQNLTKRNYKHNAKHTQYQTQHTQLFLFLESVSTYQSQATNLQALLTSVVWWLEKI